MSHRAASSVIVETAGDDVIPDIGPDDPAVHAIRGAILAGGYWLRHNEPDARQGLVEGVHRMRTAARRLRSNLDLFHDLLDGAWVERAEEELQGLGHLLGAVRDSDVMLQRLRQSGDDLGADLDPLFDAQSLRRQEALATLLAALDSPRYQGLLELLSEIHDDSTFRDDAWEPCRTALPPLVLKAWKRLKSPGRSLDLDDHDEEFHEVRKRAKRARHSAESVAPTLDATASHAGQRFARYAGVVQDVLGEHQDATMACREIRRVAAERSGDGPFNLAAGRLLERQEKAASQARTRFFKVWHKLDRAKNRRWMK